ncbi:MAG TPA: hypothetical protein VK831_07795 [Candidatus Deferrimicrobiaceae bacterium]|nr:hypothetical protein [Candidatus Deferrimicrobiaceae bacterium]
MVDGPRHAEPHDRTGFAAFDRLQDVCGRARAALVAVVHEEADDERAIRDVLGSETLQHVDAVLDGLVALARARQFSVEELRVLVRRAGIVVPPAPGSVAARAADAAADRKRGVLRPVDGRTLLAAGHARVALSLIPRLPPEAIAWPRAHRTYADIPVPRTEGELLERAEELLRVVWRVAAGDGRRDEPLRRTLAFYEAGARLSVAGFRAA